MMCRSVENKPAPQMLAASSNEASLLRNTGDNRRNASGDQSIPSTNIIPLSEYDIYIRTSTADGGPRMALTGPELLSNSSQSHDIEDIRNASDMIAAT